MNQFTRLIPKPDLSTVNTGIAPCPTGLIRSKFGAPRVPSTITAECQGATNSFWVQRIVTEDVGPFKATGHRLFLRQLRSAFAALKAANPALYEQVGSAGCLCIRWVRGTSGTLSNHSFGLAIDLTIGGQLDRRGDNQIQAGLLEIYSVFKRFGLFWGVEFSTEDAMHFEAGRDLLLGWLASGEF